MAVAGVLRVDFVWVPKYKISWQYGPGRSMAFSRAMSPEQREAVLAAMSAASEAQQARLGLQPVQLVQRWKGALWSVV